MRTHHFASLPAVLNHLEAQADYAGENQSLSVWRRVGSRGGHPIPSEVLIDLADSDRRFVRISPEWDPLVRATFRAFKG